MDEASKTRQILLSQPEYEKQKNLLLVIGSNAMAYLSYIIIKCYETGNYLKVVYTHICKLKYELNVNDEKECLQSNSKMKMNINNKSKTP